MVPPFLQRLELDASADERAIRRAYAQKLKKIDQEADPAGFQTLRAAYDAALNWARHAASTAPMSPVERVVETADRAPATESAPSYAQPKVVPRVRAEAPPGEPLPTKAPRIERSPIESVPQKPLSAKAAPQVDALARAAAAFDGFLDTFRSEFASAQSPLDRPAWQAKLEHVLASDTLVSMDAREAFEQRFAWLLTQGWKPGHEVLFAISANAFHWDADRGSLRRLGHIGAMLDRAIQERASFDLQPTDERHAQWDLIQRLRDPADPRRKELVSSIARLERVVANFPTWLGMITDLSRLARWRELFAALPQEWRDAAKPAARASTSTGSKRSGWRYGWVVLIMIGALSKLAQTPSHPSGYQYDEPPSRTRSEQTIGGARAGAGLGALPRMLQQPQPQIQPQPQPQPQRAAPVDPPRERPAAPPTKAAFAALVTKAPGPEVCSEVYRLTQLYDTGTVTQRMDLGPGFDRQIVACVARRHWPVASYNDPAVDQALRREMARTAAARRKLQGELVDPRYSLVNRPPSFTVPKWGAPDFSLPAASTAGQ
jgi:protein TonB